MKKERIIERTENNIKVKIRIPEDVTDNVREIHINQIYEVLTADKPAEEHKKTA